MEGKNEASCSSGGIKKKKKKKKKEGKRESLQPRCSKWRGMKKRREKENKREGKGEKKKKKRKPTTPAVPRRSPIQVLGRPNVA